MFLDVDLKEVNVVSPKTILKVGTDLLMTISLLLLMTYNMLGDAFHEWLGAGMLVLFLLHHILNFKWSRAIFRGKYTMYRVLQTVLVLAILLTMLGSLVSGIILSRHVFTFFGVDGGRSLARTIHLVCAYWNLVLLSVHLGLHWNSMMSMAKRVSGKPSTIRTCVLRIFAFIVAGYGVLAFLDRDIGSYMTLRTQFVFFDYEEPLFLLLADYLAIMGLFIFAGHYVAVALRGLGTKRAREKT